MRTVIVIDPDSDTPIQHLYTQTEPKAGEPVQLVTQLFGNVLGSGVVEHVRPASDWPGHFLYDVVRI
jgi:hypothetical protein